MEVARATRLAVKGAPSGTSVPAYKRKNSEERKECKERKRKGNE